MKTLKTLPLFIPLLSIFFVLHGVLENYGFVPLGDAALLVVVYIGGSLLVGALAWLLLRNMRRAMVLTVVLMGFFFFYELFIRWMTDHFPHRFFTRNSIVLSFGLGLLIAAFLFIRKSRRSFSRLYLFLNILLIVYVVIDTVWLIYKVIHPPVNPLSVYTFAKQEGPPPCDTCPKPNVYFLLFDEYAGSRALREQFQFDNSYLDSFLLREGFHINEESRSNYNITPFSIASVLNMSYIDGIRDPRRIQSQDYTNCYQLIRESSVVDLFWREGYAVRNDAIFDLAGQPSRAWQSFLPVKTRLITAGTLSERLQRHWNTLVARYLGLNKYVLHDYMRYEAVNAKFLKEVAEEADRRDVHPKFVYAHFMMPHFPYLFDSLGRRKTEKELMADWDTNPPEAYLGYLQYTNRQLIGLVGHIRQHDPGAVILLCGDHGYRLAPKLQNPVFQFQNLNAVYFPGQDYSRWRGRISFVNQFRIVFNQLFHADYPLLKDSTVLLSE